MLHEKVMEYGTEVLADLLERRSLQCNSLEGRKTWSYLKDLKLRYFCFLCNILRKQKTNARMPGKKKSPKPAKYHKPLPAV